MALIQESISEELMGHGEWAAARVRASVTDEYAPLAASHGELRSEKSTSDDEPAVVRELNETGAHGAAPRDLSRGAQAAYLAQYFSVGLVFGGLPATIYGLFIGYLNVPAHVYSATHVVMTLPWTFKWLFGLLNDVVPIAGYRRKPYMALGWACCCTTLLVLSQCTLPPPYWCRDKQGRYITSHLQPDGSHLPATPCNASAASSGGRYALLMCLAALGYVVADVAADGLTVQMAMREPTHERGRTQTAAYLTRTLGAACAVSLIGFGMNGPEYHGTFASGLSFNAICALLAVPTALMVPVSWFCIDEPKAQAAFTTRALVTYLRTTRTLLSSRAMFYIVLYQFVTPVIGHVSSTAGGLVKRYWAGVQNLQNQIFTLIGNGLFAIGLALVRRYYLNSSWRAMLLITTVLLNLIDMSFVFCTVFDVVRNQYFYLGETVLVEIPSAANFVVSTFIVVEMAENCNEGLVYGLLTTMHNLGNPVARAIGNQLFSTFTPSLSDSSNYIEDTRGPAGMESRSEGRVRAACTSASQAFGGLSPTPSASRMPSHCARSSPSCCSPTRRLRRSGASRLGHTTLATPRARSCSPASPSPTASPSTCFQCLNRPCASSSPVVTAADSIQAVSHISGCDFLRVLKRLQSRFGFPAVLDRAV